MPRPRKPDGGEPKSRSRNGCWSCKARKVKCTEERPSCSKCIKGGYQCDYGIRLNWDGRRSKRPQLKAVHLDAERLGDDGDNADFSVFLGDGGDDGDTAGTRPPPMPQSQHEMQFQLDPTVSPPSSSSSTFSAAPTSSNAMHQSLNLVSFHMSEPTALAALPHSGKQPTSRQGGTTGQFQVLTTSPTMSQFEVRRPVKQLKGSSKGASAVTSAPPGSSAARPSIDFQRTPLPAMHSLPTSQPYMPGSIDESISSSDTVETRQHQSKRQRMDSDVSERDFAWTWPISPSTGSGSLSATSPRQLVLPPTFAPAKPFGESSSPRPGDDNQGRASPLVNGSLIHLQATSDFRRLSVSSLLSGPVDPNSTAGTPPTSATPPAPSTPQAADSFCSAARTQHQSPHKEDGNPDHLSHYDHQHRSSHYYGIDCGFQDLDLGKNDDATALSGTRDSRQSSRDASSRRGAAHGQGGYYSKPVYVRIPRALGKLPPKLTENPMNLLYFHHFINNTARVLVPHDDPQSNPFRTILPQMAINNDNLLSLLLAYSASHRARVLDQTEPAMRIALWVQDIFPALRNALGDHKQKISNANVATAIMLASLAIVSPTAFGYDIPWQRHLMLARELIRTRPEGLRVDHHSSVEGQVCSFLWSWFAYLDVLGGLSGGPTDASPAWILDYKVYDPQDDDEIDCIMGFTTRCVYILSQIAELVRQWEPERLRVMKKDPYAWIPSMQIERSVQSLEVDVHASMSLPPRPCSHLHHSGDVVRWDRNEMTATNEAYHWAALVHLHRRVLGKSTDHSDVQYPVRKIIDCIDRVRTGGTAENCLLLPLFTAACECIEDGQRKNLLNRILSMEGSGMMQVTRARALMQKAWGTGKPWETLLTTEFIG